ncbi:MAG: DUF637 domain-containing protein [Methylobacillus sp.]|nr:DUF637 domain-containing protein [Methylobacillus sp.]
MARGSTAILDGQENKLSRFRRALTFTVLLTFLSQTLVSPVMAQVVAYKPAPGNQKPTLLNAGNGVPLINIQTPSAGGVSVNKYEQLDVGAQGIIFNNSRTNASTQLGGWVQGNPWLAGGTAKVILNEVYSSSPSLLGGYMEIAGDRAQLIIANPAGITCDGCGFLNANRVTLTTGTVTMNNGAITGYQVENGLIRVEGAGMDASRANYTDLISRAVEVNAGLWAQTLTVTTGQNTVNAANTIATLNPTASGTAPTYAVDVAQLGGMYAGKITMVGTEAGVGVRNAGQIGASAGDVVVTADGQLVNKGAMVADTGSITVQGSSLQNDGTMAAAANVAVTTPGDINNTGLMQAGRELRLNTPGNITNTGYMDGQRLDIAANTLDNSGTLRQSGLQALSIDTATVTNSSTALIGNLPETGSAPTDPAATGVTDTPSTAGAADITVETTAPLMLADGQITTSTLTNTGSLAVGGATLLATQTFANDGTMNLAALTVSSDFRNQGAITSGTLNAATSSFDNHNGAITLNAPADNTIHTTGALNNADGSIVSAGSLDITAASLNNDSGTISAQGDLIALVDGNLSSNSDTSQLLAGDALTLVAGGTLTNRGIINGGDTLIQAALLNNLGTGAIYGDHLAIAADILNNVAESGTAPVIAARTRLDLGVGTLNNTDEALIYSAGDMSIGGALDADRLATGQADSIVNISATIEAAGGLAINTQSLVNSKRTLVIGTAPDSGPQDDTIALLDRFNLYYYWTHDESTISRWRSEIYSAYLNRINSLLGGTLTAEDMTAMASAVNALDAASLSNSINIWHAMIGALQDNDPAAIDALMAVASTSNLPYTVYSQQCTDWYDDCSYVNYTTTSTAYSKNVVTQDSPTAVIRAGGGMAINADTLVNQYSAIQSGGDMVLTGATLTNIGAELFAFADTAQSVHRIHWADRDHGTTYSYWSTQSLIGTVPAIISAGGTLTGSFIDRIDNITIRENAGVVVPGSDPGNGSDALSADAEATLELPANRLYGLAPAGTAHYLIETDPRFANYRKWLSSDYMLKQLSIDPALSQMRLGDGFYEQQLLLEQIAQLTGRPFLEGYTNYEEQYQALMDAGVSVSGEMHLTLGVALTAEQIAQLTTDIVWLVSEPVTLADGSTQNVLVPKLYARPGQHDLAPSGAFLAANDIQLVTNGDIYTSGAIAGRNTVILSADNITNERGAVSGTDIAAIANTDLIVYGGTITARDSLTAVAGNDLIVEGSMVTRSYTPGTEEGIHAEPYANVTNTFVDRKAGLYVTGENGTLVAASGHDMTLLAAEIKNTGDTTLVAGNNLVIGTQAETTHGVSSGNGNSWRLDTVTQIGSTVETDGNLTAQAGSDMAIIGSALKADGDVSLIAGNDLTIASAANSTDMERHHKSSDVKSDAYASSVTQVSSTVEAGQNLTLTAGQDITLIASDLVAGNNATLSAEGDINFLAAQNESYSLFNYKSSGSFGKKSTRRDEVYTLTQMGSSITTGGDLTLESGNDQTFQVATLNSGGDLLINAGGSIDFEGVKDFKQESHQKSSSSWAWQSAKGKGGTDETLRLSRLNATGDLVIQAANKIHIDIPEINKQSVSQTIDALVKAEPQLTWLKEMDARGDIDWQRVKELHDHWSYSESGMGPGLSLAIAIVVSAISYGAASEMIAGVAGVGEGTAAASASAWAAGGWANAATATVMSSMASNFTVSLINNKGNFGQALQDTFSESAMKGYLVSGLTAGLVISGTQALQDAGLLTKGSLTSASFADRFATYSAKAVIGAGVQSIILGKPLDETLQTALITSLTQSLTAEIGDIGEGNEAMIAKTLAHAIVQCASANIQGGNCDSAALGAVTAELLSPYLNDLSDSQLTAYDKNLGTTIAGLSAILAAGLTGQDPNAASIAAQMVDAYNRQLHPSEYAIARKYASLVAMKLGITIEEAKGRIAAELLRNSDATYAAESGGVFDFQIRSLLGCELLNCSAGTTVDHYEDHDYNSQYIASNRDVYDAGMSWLSVGMTEKQFVEFSRQQDRGVSNFLIDLSPIIGDLKAFAEAETPWDYILAIAGIVPGGDLLKTGKKAEKEIADAGGFIIDNKIAKQIPERGWTKQEIQEVIDKGPVGTSIDKRGPSKAPDGVARNDTATVYGSKDGYIVRNDRTGEIVQISDKTDPNWIADSRIQWK